MALDRLQRLLVQVRACTVCASALPNPPRPVLRAGSSARVLIVGQAPGRRVHETGIPWNDPSGDLLREWLAIDRAAFYDASRIAIIPAGFCYPGKGPSGDLPPRPECAPLWHPPLKALLRHVRLTLLVGQYAQAYTLGDRREDSLAGTVRAWRRYAPEYFPLPHPSPRNRRWLKNNSWFEREVIPELRKRFQSAVNSSKNP